MATPDEQARLREHLAELRKAAHGIGKDVEIELGAIADKIEKLPSRTAKDAKYALYEIEDDLAAAGHTIDRQLKKLPGEIGRGMVAAGSGIKNGAVRLGGATRDTLETVGHKTKEGTKNVLATAAGVRKTPIKEWRHPSEEAKEGDA
ncbi:MAG: hypothetical protein L3J93_03895 [Thermoplasmata archaeon]|nr:hypothetical protein [Thermoplasmata archaeon]